MTLWTKFKEFVEQVAGSEERASHLDGEELRMATAALLVRASVIDGSADPAERATLKARLVANYDLSADEVDALIASAETREREAVDLYRFTSVLCRQLDQEGRQGVVEMLWEVVMANGVVDEFEANLVWRVAELLGVSTRDRIRLRKQVAAGQAGEGG